MNSSSFFCRTFVLLAWLISMITAAAAPPVNDNFASRINLGNTFPTSANGTNVEATEQTGEPLPLSGLASVWWRWTAPAAGQVEVNTSGSLSGADPLDTVLAVYTGTTLAGLVQVAANDEAANDSTSLLRFTATAGTTYVIQVLGWEGAEGSVKLNLKAGPPLPVNDAFANAITLTTGVTASGTSDGATLQPSEAVPVGITSTDYVGSSWWAWTAPAAGWYRLVVSGATFNQVASVWTGTAVNALTAVHSIGGGNNSAELFFPATAGTRYPIAVGNVYITDGKAVSLTVTSVPAPPAYNASLTVSASSVNVTSAPATVNAVFRIVSAEPLTDGSVEISDVGGFFYRLVSFTAAQRTSGTSTDGSYTVPLLFARYHPPGAHRISRIYLSGDGFNTGVGELIDAPFASGSTRNINVTNTGTVDSTAPVLTSVGVSPGTVDVTAGPQNITATLQITDSLSGFLSGRVELVEITAGGFGSTLTSAAFGSSQRTAGTAQNGTYTVNLTIPSDALGNYSVEVFGIQDAIGNQTDATGSTDPSFPGPFTGPVRVNRTPLHLLNSFTLSPSSVNVTTAAVNVTATCSITTSSGEFSYGYLTLDHSAGNDSISVFVNPSDRTGGTAASGTYSVTFPVPRFRTPGSYAATFEVHGTVGGSSRYGEGEFAFPSGASTFLTVANSGTVDSAAPVISFVSAAPNSFTAGSATPLVAKVRVTDDLAGVDSVSIYLTAFSSYYYFGEAVRISGTALDGVWELSAPLPALPAPGLYAIEFGAVDVSDRSSYFTTNPDIPAQSVNVTAAAADPFNSFTSNNGLSGNDALPSSDSDRDGVDVFSEFGLGMDPRSGPANPAGPAVAGPPAFNLTGSGAARRLTLGFWIPADILQGNALKLSYTARFSSDGTNWTDVPQTSFVIDAGTSLTSSTGLRRYCTVTDPAPYSESQPRFGVLRMSLIP